jgi:predicted RNA-binding protein
LPWEGKVFGNVQLLSITKGFLVNNRLSKDFDSILYDSPRNPRFPASDGDIMFGGMGAYPEPGSFWTKERVIFDVGYEQKVTDQGLFKTRFWKNWGEREAFNTVVARNRMCEAAAYILKNGQEELLLSEVDIVEPEGDGLRLVNIFAEQKVIRAAIHSLNLVNHKVFLVEK